MFRVLLAGIVFLGVGMGMAQAGTIGAPAGPDPFTLTFDENGNGTYSQFQGPQNVPTLGFAAVDPNTGSPALTYALPEFIGPGIVGINEADGSLSDAISFYNTANGGFMAYYSGAGDADLADTISQGFLPVVAFSINEVGPEGANGFNYVAGSGDPATTNFYNGISDLAPVPEPASIVLLGSGMGLAGLLRWRRQRRAAV